MDIIDGKDFDLDLDYVDGKVVIRATYDTKGVIIKTEVAAKTEYFLKKVTDLIGKIAAGK